MGAKCRPEHRHQDAKVRYSLGASVHCEQSTATRSSAAGSLPLRKPAVGTSPPARLLRSRSSVRLRRGYTCLLFLHTSAGKNPAGSVPGRQDTAVRIRSRLLAQTVSGFRYAAPATDCAGGMVPGLTAMNVFPSIRQWAVPAQAPEGVCPPTTSVSSAVPGSLASPFHGAPEPAAPHAARHPPGPRSTSFRALWHWQTHSRRTRPPLQPSRL